MGCIISLLSRILNKRHARLRIVIRKLDCKFRRITQLRFATRKNSVFGNYSGTNTEPNRELLLNSSNIRIRTLKFGFSSDFEPGWYSCFD